jgi:hypothetical protein
MEHSPDAIFYWITSWSTQTLLYKHQLPLFDDLQKNVNVLITTFALVELPISIFI